MIENLLRQQILELTKLLELKDRRIMELEALQTVNRGIFIPSQWTTPCEHYYPNPWFGTVPPSCTKCGQSQLHMPLTVTSGTTFEIKG